MNLTKVKKLLVATTITTLTLGSIVYATPVVYKNLKVHYNVNLVVNGAPYVGASDATKPFITDGGRTYISIASLVESKIANASYDAATSTVAVTGQTANQDQITALSNQILALENQNSALKVENEALKKANTDNKKPNDDKKPNNGGNLELKSITKSSDRSDLERDIVKELRGKRASVYGFGSQRYDDAATVKISTSSNKVSVTLTDSEYFGLKTGTDTRAKKWNDYASSKKYAEDVQESYETFIEEDIIESVKDVLNDYSGYDIEVEIRGLESNSSTAKEYDLVYAKYTDSKDTLKTSVYEIL
ncbi:MAG: hypothetical protein ACRDA4_06765 [Filifactoraceae bacterium]